MSWYAGAFLIQSTCFNKGDKIARVLGLLLHNALPKNDGNQIKLDYFDRNFTQKAQQRVFPLIHIIII